MPARPLRSRQALQDRTNVISTPVASTGGQKGKHATAQAKENQQAKNVSLGITRSRTGDGTSSKSGPKNTPDLTMKETPRSSRAARAHGARADNKIEQNTTGHQRSSITKSSMNTGLAELQQCFDESSISNEQILGQDMDSTEEISETDMLSFTGSVLQATPLAAELSSKALRTFRRRPRQPSMLAMVQQRVASTRSSLAASRTATSPSDSIYDIDGVEDDFQPDLAGTPAHVSRARISSTPAVKESSRRSSTRTEARAGLVRTADMSREAGHRLPSASHARQRRSHLRRSASGVDSSITISNSPDAGTEFVTALDDAQQSDDHVLGEFVVHTALASRDSVLDAQIAASPEDTSVFADPSSQLTPSPDRGRSKRRRVNKVPSTADLQSLLPRRRRAFTRGASTLRDSAGCISPTGSLNDDDDSFHLSKTNGKTSRKQCNRSTASKIAEGQARIGSRAANTRRSPEPSLIAAARQTGGKRAAYSSRSKPNSANQNIDIPADQGSEDDTNTSVYVTSISDDLQAAKRKFAEIDEWKLDFENMTPEDDSTRLSQEYR